MFNCSRVGNFVAKCPYAKREDNDDEDNNYKEEHNNKNKPYRHKRVKYTGSRLQELEMNFRSHNNRKKVPTLERTIAHLKKVMDIFLTLKKKNSSS